MAIKLFLIPLLALTAFAQISAPRLVEVNVIVHDKSGIVGDLTPRDFTLFDKGKEQKIASVLINNGRGAQQALAPNVFSNHPDQGGAGGSITVILLDALNTATMDQASARQRFAKILSEIKPSDHVAVYALGARLRILSDFGAHLEGGDRAAEDWLNDLGLTSGLNIQDRLANTVSALVTISQHVGHLPGRKNLLWVAGSFPVSVDHRGAEGPPGWEAAAVQRQATGIGKSTRSTDDASQFDRQVFQKLFDPAMQALHLNNISVYAADSRGLVTGLNATTTTTATRDIGSDTAAPSDPSVIRTLTEDTGGRVFESGTDIQKAVRRAIDDTELTYTLTYYPDTKSLDKNFHDLKVQLGRKDLDAFYRKGYLAIPEPKVSDAQRLDAIKAALVNPLAAGAVGLMGGFEKSDDPKPGSLRTAVIISAPDLLLQHQGDQWTGEVDVIIVARTADGKEAGTYRQPLALKLTQAQYDQVMKQGLSIQKTLEPTAAVAEIRAIVADRISGRVGSLIMPVK